MESVVFQLRGFQNNLLLPRLVMRRPFWQWLQSLCCCILFLRAAALNSNYNTPTAGCSALTGRKSLKVGHTVTTDCILQSCGNEIGSHL